MYCSLTVRWARDMHASNLWQRKKGVLRKMCDESYMWR